MSTNSHICAIIEEGCRFEGNLSFNGVVRIAGTVTGSIFSNDTLIVSEGAIINADINANVILISGTVKGNIKATSRVEIKKPRRYFRSTGSSKLSPRTT